MCMARDAVTPPSSMATIWITSTTDTGTPPTKATTTNTDRTGASYSRAGPLNKVTVNAATRP